MEFLAVFWPALAAVWAVVGIACINPGIREAESFPWGSEKEGGELTKLGLVMVGGFYILTGPFYVIDLLSTKR